jgi:2-methylcitrate dehydratase PrpD
MNETSRLAEFLSGLKYDDLPPDVVEIAKLCILDTVGVGLSGGGYPWSKIVAEQVEESGGSGEAFLWGRSARVPAQQAALANATAAHGIEMDDRLPTAQEHPGSMAVPAALALAEKTSANGRALITSIVVGYELGIRVGFAIRFKNPGLHWAGHKGVWPAVGAAAKALDLECGQMQDAFGLAGSMACGLGEFSQDPRGTMVKRLHGGLASYHGVLAALLAQRGLTGPGTVLEGLYGYCRVFSSGGEPRYEELDRELSHSYRILQREVKPYASWGGGHNAIDAVGQILAEGPLDPAKITRIQIGGSRFMTETHSLKEPRSVMAAQYSLPFLTALALSRGPEALMDPRGVWTDETLDDPELAEMIAKTEVYIDPYLEELSLEWRHYGGAKVTVETAHGTRREALVHHSKGTTQNPMSPDEIKTKFRAVAGPALPAGRIEEIIACINDLENVDDVRELSGLLVNRERPAG